MALSPYQLMCGQGMFLEDLRQHPATMRSDVSAGAKRGNAWQVLAV